MYMYMSMTQRQNIVIIVYQQIRTLIKFQVKMYILKLKEVSIIYYLIYLF